MLKKRLIGCLTVKDGRVVQSTRFSRFLPVGRVDISVEALNRWGIDEIIILDIDATRIGRKPDFGVLRSASAKAFIPVAFGGGITTVREMREAIHSGADKVVINTAAFKTPALIEESAHIFGKQCIVVSVDVKKNAQGWYEVYTAGGRDATGMHLETWVREADRLGAGEIFVNAIDCDGVKKGFDIAMLKMVQNAVQIPVIGCGGAGHPEHFAKAFRDTQVAALAAGNYFHFTEQSPVVTKSYLKGQGINVRFDTEAIYEDAEFTEDGRIGKWPEHYLRELRYRVIQEEKI